MKIVTKYKYKLSLQQVLLNYFKMNFEVKIVRPLVAFKNLKFFRLVYATKRHHRNKEKKIRKIKKLLRKTLIFRAIPLKQRYLVMTTRSLRFAKIINPQSIQNIKNKSQKKEKKNKKLIQRNTYVCLKKPDPFERLRKKETLENTKNTF